MFNFGLESRIEELETRERQHWKFIGELLKSHGEMVKTMQMQDKLIIDLRKMLDKS